jgi:gamma-glutamylputrescine oxidase
MPQTSYPESYYAASANPVPSRPALQGDIETDICIIGAGYTGLSTAFPAGKRLQGYRPGGRQVGFGASGRNGGQIVNSYSRDIDVIERSVGGKQANCWATWL